MKCRLGFITAINTEYTKYTKRRSDLVLSMEAVFNVILPRYSCSQSLTTYLDMEML